MVFNIQSCKKIYILKRNNSKHLHFERICIQKYLLERISTNDVGFNASDLEYSKL